MKTVSQIKKIKAALLYILKDFPEGIDCIKLFKILYFAQREHNHIFKSTILLQKNTH
jgi:hypothetical protein